MKVDLIKNKGFTFSETMISAAIVLIVLGLIFCISWSGLKIGGREEDARNIIKTADFLLASLKKDFRSCAQVSYDGPKTVLIVKKVEKDAIIETIVTYEAAGLNIIRTQQNSKKEFDFTSYSGQNARLDFRITEKAKKLHYIVLSITGEDKKIYERSEIISAD
jgi:hypothetical protein